MNPTLIRTALLLVGALLLAFVPWKSSVHGDGMVGAERRTVIFAPRPAQVAEILVVPGQRVAEGELLFRLAAPDLLHQAAQHRRAIENLGWQIDILSQQPDGVARAAILARERDSVRLQLAAAEAAITQLELRAPFAGAVLEAADPLGVGEWVERGEPLALVVDRGATLVEALVAEADAQRLSVGAGAEVRPRNPDFPAFQARVEAIDASAQRELVDPALASTSGGPIAARQGPNRTVVPEKPVYRVRLRPTEPVAPDMMEIATLRIDGVAESFAERVWRTAWGVLVRESGF